MKHIAKFENLNDFHKKPDVDQVASRVVERTIKKNPSEKKIHKDSVYDQFGFESSGQADLVSL